MIEAGSYTQIVGIYGPSEARVGDTVIINVAVKNIWSGAFYVTILGKYDGVDINPSLDYLLINPGETLYFYFTFTMPAKNITLDFRSYYWADSQWLEDDSQQASIDLISSLAGEILDKWVNKAPEGNHLSLPASVVVDGNTFEIGVRGRNNSSIAIRAGMEVTVWDPDDGPPRAKPTIDWASLSPGAAANWEYNISRVDKSGNWTAIIRFLAED